MKAAALMGPGRVELINAPEPECGPDQVLLRMLGVGLCGSDLAVHSGAREVPRTPWILGHEGVGEIVAVGAEVRGRRVGQRVAIEPNYCCLRCAACRRGFTSACRDRIVIGIGVPGVMAEYVAAPAEFTFPVAEHVSTEDLVCTEPLTVARAAIRRSGLAPGEACLVVGTGSQGLFMCLALLAAGHTPHVIEPHEGRRALALSLGAKEAGPADAEFDCLFETSGAASALAPALDHLAPGGTAVLVGIGHRPLGVTSAALVYRQLRLIGSLIYDHPSDFTSTMESLDGGDLAPSRVLRAEFPLAEAAEAFDSVRETPGKCWVRIGA